MKTDVLVIGGGIAGFTSALKARAMGREVILVSGRPGASFMHSGIFDIDADPGRVKDISVSDKRKFADNLVSINAVNPRHPFSVTLGDPDGEDIFYEAVNFFFDALASGGLEIAGLLGDRFLLANNLGTLKRSRFALKSIAAGDMLNHESMKTAIVGIAGLPEFDAKFIAASLEELTPRATRNYFQSLEAFEIELPGHAGFSNLTPFSIANLMDEPGFAEILSDVIKEKVSGIFTHIGFPAVLGIERHAEIMNKLGLALESTIFEIATVQPSVPGKRISVAMEKQLSSAGVKMIEGRASGFNAIGGKVKSVSVDAPHGGNVVIEAESIVLATGKFISGGIVHDSQLREPVFGLPVFTENGPVRKEALLMEYGTRKIAERQQIMTCGVAVNEILQATDADMKPVFGNLFCAGSVISGYDPYRDGCGTGVAAVTGYTAGLNAVSRK